MTAKSALRLCGNKKGGSGIFPKPPFEKNLN